MHTGKQTAEATETVQTGSREKDGTNLRNLQINMDSNPSSTEVLRQGPSGRIGKNSMTFSMDANVANMSNASAVLKGFKGDVDISATDFKLPVTNKWGLVGSTKIKIRTNNTLRIILGLLLVLITTAVILCSRIQKLEEKNDSLESQIQGFQDRLICVMAKVSQMQGKSVEIPRGINCFDDNDAEGDDYNWATVDENEPEDGAKRKKRSALIDDEGVNGVNATGISLTLPPKAVLGRKRERGNNITTTTRSRKLSVLRWIKQRKQDRANLAKLKLKLQTARNRAKSAKSLAETYKQTLQTESVYHDDARAAYLTVRDTNINIRNPEQLIGPWHIAESGKDIGFNDLWYQNIALDYNGTSVIFQENGLYLIYAQVFYKSTLRKKDKPAPMGFRIYLKKNENIPVKIFHRPIPIAECVPSFPTTYYQTCFTQICWYVEEGDEIYLEHFTDATPVIESEKMGQTFLGIVRLSH